MSTLFVVGLAVWMIGAGVAKLPNTGISGGLMQVVGGVLVLLGAFL